MKRVNHLCDALYDIDNIIDMTNLVLSKIKNKRRRENFILHKMEHVINIYNRLVNNEFTFEKYNIFLITDPKVRVIMSQNIEDKIINHLIAEYLLVRVFEPKYINSMCATRKGMGTSYAIKLMKSYFNEIKVKNSNFYILKIDIKKYFYNIDHNVLKRILKDNIKDNDALNILYKIIDSTNVKYINEKITSLKNKRIKYLKDDYLIKETRDIPIYQYGKGCGIGDMTSQAFGLIYIYLRYVIILKNLYI